MTPTLRTWFPTLIGVALMGLLAACQGGGHAPQPPVPVLVAKAERRDVSLSLRTVGTVEPIEAAAVKAQVTGMVTAVLFTEGQEVKAGQLLVQIDPRSYQAALGQAQARLEKDRADLAHARAQLTRYDSLSAQGIVSADQLEALRTQADVLQGTVKEDEQAVSAARLDVGFATVRAPIAGRAGAALVKQGNVVKANEVTLVTLNRMHPIRVAFALPGPDLQDIRRFSATRPLEVHVSGTGDDGERKGSLVFVDNAVDSSTGTVALKGEFPNEDGALWPGQMVQVQLVLQVEKGVLAVPDAAVLTGQQGTYAFAVLDGKAQKRNVKAVRSADGWTVIAGGLVAGETVVTDGQLRLLDGTPVTLKDGLGAGTPR